MNRLSSGASRTALLLAALSAAFAAYADSGAPAASSRVLGIGDCVEMALAASDQAASAAAKARAAASRLGFARSQYLPSLALSGSFAHSSEIEPGSISFGPQTIELPESRQDAWLFRLTLQQPLFTGFRIEGGIAQAKAALDAARAEERRAAAAAASSAEKAWWALYLAGRSAAVVEESAAAQRAHVAEAQARLEGGTGLAVELLSARMRESDLEALSTEARSALSLARARLNLLIGLPWNAPTSVAEPPEPEPADGRLDPASLAAAAMASRPELAAADARVSMQRAAAATAKSPLLPNVFLTGSYSLADPNPKAFPQRDGFESYWDIGLTFSFDVGKIPGTLAQAAEARAGLEEASLALAQARDAVQLEIISACLELEKLEDRLQASGLSVELAEATLASQEDRYDTGLAVESAVADAENDLLRAKLERARSRVSWELARLALRDAIGE